MAQCNITHCETGTRRPKRRGLVGSLCEHLHRETRFDFETGLAMALEQSEIVSVSFDHGFVPVYAPSIVGAC